MHCADPGCLKACPAPGAIVQYSNGIVDFTVTKPHRLRLLHHRLSFNIPRISQRTTRPHKCSLCSRSCGFVVRRRLAPRSVRPVIQFGSERAERRITPGGWSTSSRAATRRGLHDPRQAGGTHVMYVLHHAIDWSSPQEPAQQPRHQSAGACGRASLPVAIVAMAAVALGSLFTT
ncbi:MAG: hypothetical protein IPN05_16260 [Sulfuritalea sp.]|nr:hypothetical protein [Sulfuritalea sp.]